MAKKAKTKVQTQHDVACTHCGAMPGERCASPSQTVYYVHAARQRAFDAWRNGQQSLDLKPQAHKTMGAYRYVTSETLYPRLVVIEAVFPATVGGQTVRDDVETALEWLRAQGSAYVVGSKPLDMTWEQACGVLTDRYMKGEWE